MPQIEYPRLSKISRCGFYHGTVIVEKTCLLFNVIFPVWYIYIYYILYILYILYIIYIIIIYIYHIFILYIYNYVRINSYLTYNLYIYIYVIGSQQFPGFSVSPITPQTPDLPGLARTGTVRHRGLDPGHSILPGPKQGVSDKWGGLLNSS